MLICGRCRKEGVPQPDQCTTVQQVRAHYLGSASAQKPATKVRKVQPKG
jgi:hypothetical protein